MPVLKLEGGTELRVPDYQRFTVERGGKHVKVLDALHLQPGDRLVVREVFVDNRPALQHKWPKV